MWEMDCPLTQSGAKASEQQGIHWHSIQSTGEIRFLPPPIKPVAFPILGIVTDVLCDARECVVILHTMFMIVALPEIVQVCVRTHPFRAPDFVPPQGNRS